MNEECYIMEFGKWAGHPITDVGTDYLLWMVRADHTHKMEAVKDLCRRGIVVPKVKVTLSAVDQVSIHCMDWYMKTRDSDKEGFVTWLRRTCRLAILYGDAHAEIVEWMGFIFTFDFSGKVGILKKIKPSDCTQLDLENINSEIFL